MKEILFFFDIETSTVPIDNEREDLPLQVMFLGHMLGMNMTTKEIVYDRFIRNMYELKPLLEDIKIDKTLCTEGEEIIIYIHNLNYELEFILREYEGNSINEEKQKTIFRGRKSPLQVYLSTFPNVCFRCSYALFNKSVKQLGEDLKLREKEKDLRKLDYEYKEVRLPTSELEEIDYMYNKRDNEIVAYSIYHFLKEYNYKVDEIPLTFTSNARKLRMKSIKTNRQKSLKMEKKKEFVSPHFYMTEACCYQGGLTGCVPKNIGKVFDDVLSIDIKSSYPYQMESKIFPRYYSNTTSYFEGEEASYIYSLIEGNENKLVKRQLIRVDNYKIRGYIGNFVLSELKVKKEGYMLDLSFSKCLNNREMLLNGNYIKVNGKIEKASEVNVILNEVDMYRLSLIYNFKVTKCNYIYTTNVSKLLPHDEKYFILNNFKIKETINKKKFPIEYAQAKVTINSMYGIKVTQYIRDEYYINDGLIDCFTYDAKNLCKNYYDTDMIEYEEKIEEMKEKQRKGKDSNIDFFSDGIYITSYARLQLVEMIVKLVDNGHNVIYSDTDSIKVQVKNINNFLSIINEINKNIIERNESDYENYYILFNVNNNDRKKVSRLGIWEVENGKDDNGNYIPYPYFKSLGAKKYCYIEEGKIKITIAGCSKSKSAEAITNYANKNNLSLTEALNKLFDVGTEFDITCSGRTVPTYEYRIMKEREVGYEELFYNGIPIISKGGIVIEDSTYLLNNIDIDEMEIDKYEEIYLGKKSNDRDVKRSLSIEGYLIEYE